MTRQKEWQNAQILEKSYQQLPRSRLKSKPSQLLNQRFDLDKDFFFGKYVLEIGVSFISKIHGIDGASLKVGLDPLAKYYAPAYPKSAEHIQGRGEELPFIDNCLDAIICINTLDHTEKPHFVLLQIRRCLKKGGLLLFSVNTFPIPKFLRQYLLRRIDPMHPHHFSEKEVRLMFKDTFEIVTCFYKKHTFRERLRYIKELIRSKKFGSVLKLQVAETFFGLRQVWIKCK